MLVIGYLLLGYFYAEQVSKIQVILFLTIPYYFIIHKFNYKFKEQYNKLKLK